jgi:hypothetical protein
VVVAVVATELEVLGGREVEVVGTEVVGVDFGRVV